MKYLGKLFDGLFDRIFVLVVALAFAQLPQIMDLYVAALTGAQHEASIAVKEYEAAANKGGKDLETYIQKHETNSDADFQETGKVMRNQVRRYENYTSALTAFREAGPFTRWIVFLRHYQQDLLQKIDLKPGVPVHAEGIFYTLLGLLIGVLVYHFVIRLPVQKIFGVKK